MLLLRYKHAADAIHFDNSKRIAYFKPYDPNDVYPPIIQDSQELIGYHHVSKSAIEDVAHEFNKDVRIIGIDHANIAQSSLVENFIARGGYKFPKSNYFVPDGSWIVGIKMESDELWEKAKSGQIKGISPAGDYIDRYYDDNTSKWVVDKLSCKELSLVIDKVPDNKTPILYLHANEGVNNMNQDKSKEQKTGDDKAGSLSSIINSKYEQVNASGKKDVQKESDPALNQTLSELSNNIKENTETIKRTDPNYEKKMAAKERNDLIKTLQESRDPAAKSLLMQLRQPSGTGDKEPEIAGYGFDMNNLQTDQAAGNQQTFQDTGIQQPQTKPFEQKKSPDFFVDPEDYINQKKQEGEPKKEIPKELIDKAEAIDKKYKNRTLDPWDKFEETNALANSF